MKLFPSCVNVIGLHGLFWIHSGISIMMCILGIQILPETQGKTLTELSEIYSVKPKYQDSKYGLKDTQKTDCHEIQNKAYQDK